MRSSRRVTQRVAPALASVASVLLFATCDFDKISGTPTPLSQQEIDRLFSITPTDTTIFLGGTTTLSVAPGANIDLSGTTTTWSSSQPGVVSIVEGTGLATGVALGNATITARVIAPELDTGYSKTRSIRVRFKGIDGCTAPGCASQTLDSITGLNLSRPFFFVGTNNTDERVPGALTGVTVTTSDSGATTNTVAAVSGSNVFARRNGIAYVIGVFEDMRDSIKVKVRQVAKSLTFPTTEYTANSLNADRTIPLTVTDVNDSVMTSFPVVQWTSSDTSVVTIDPLSGVLRVKKLDTARIFVQVDTVQASQKLIVSQALASLEKAAGDEISDTVALAVEETPLVTALDSGSTPISDLEVTFRLSGGGGTIADSVYLTDASGQARLGTWILGPSTGEPNTVIASAGGQEVTFTIHGLPQRAFKLGFQTQPNAVSVNAGINPPVAVVVRDSLGNHTVSATDSVFIALGNNPSGATLSGATRVAAVDGIATFENLAVSASGTGYTLIATGGALQNSVSDAFDVFDAATQLVFTRQPVGTSQGAVLDSILVAIRDAGGTTVGIETRDVSLSIESGPVGGSLVGTTTVAAVGGVAVFTGLRLSAAGDYTLRATASPLTDAVSSTFTVSAVGAPDRLAFITQPNDVEAGATPNFQVEIQDANGALVATATHAVTISLNAGNSGASLSGELTRNAVDGVATFPGIFIDKAGSGYTLRASEPSLQSSDSEPFDVTAGSAAKLGFIGQPTHTVSGTTMEPAVTVSVQDAFGNLVTGTPTSVTLTVTSCSSTSNSGLGPVNTVDGLATFSSIVLGSEVTNCQLTANASGLNSATSTQFNSVSSTGAIRLLFDTQPTQSTAGNSIPQFSVRVADANGNTVGSVAPNVTLSVLSGPTTSIFSNTDQTAFGGVATFSFTELRTAGTYKLLATSPGFKADSSNAFTVVAATLNKVGFVQQPTSITAGDPFSPVISASFQDQFGNTVTSAVGDIEIGIQNGPGFGTQLVGTRTRSAVNGVVNFTGLTINRAFAGYTLFVQNPGSGLFASQSNAFNVNTGPVSTLTLSGEPGNMTAGNTFSVTAQATDAVGNAITSFSNPITIGLTGGDGTATVVGPNTITPTNGVASFSGLSIEKAGTNYSLTASASGLSTATGTSVFEVFAGSATKLGWLDTPQNTVQNAGIDNGSGGLVRVAAQDQYGNTANFFERIRITIGNNPGGLQLVDNGFVATSKDYFGDNGIFSLSSLSLRGEGNGATLTATTPFASLTSATSAAFDVAAFGSPTKLAFNVQPSNGTYAVALNPAVEVRIEDDFGNTVTSSPNAVTLTLANDPAGNTTLSGGTATNAVNGVATFAGLYLDKTGDGFTIQATADGQTSVTSNGFNITSPGFVATSSNLADMTRLGDRIYWVETADDGTLKSVSVTGGTVTTHTNAPTARARRIANDGTNIYWIEAGTGSATGSVFRYSVSANTTTKLAQSLSDVRSESNTFATDGTNVYFLARSESGTTAAIKKVSATDGLQAPTDIHAGGAFTGLSFFFTVSNGIIYFHDDNADKLARIATDGTGFAWMTDIVGFTNRLVLGSNNTLYFSESGNIKVLTNANTAVGLIPSEPVIGIGFIYDMAIEGNNLYVKTDNVVRRYNVTILGSGGSSADLATNGRFDYQTLLLDDAHIYYSNNSSGIGKIQK